MISMKITGGPYISIQIMPSKTLLIWVDAEHLHTTHVKSISRKKKVYTDNNQNKLN